MNPFSKFTGLLIISFFCSNTIIGQAQIFNDTILSNYEIVLLGEQTHGDGAVFEKKLSMVKELHENGGFNLLIFESGMYDNFKANQLYSTKKESINIFKQSVGYLYSDTQVFQDLLDYIETHPKLKILGFDSQESSLFQEYYLKDLKKLCTKNNISISDATYLELEKTIIVRDLENYINNKKDSTILYNRIQDIQNKIDLIPRTNLETKVIIQTFKSVFSDLDFILKDLQKEKIHLQNPRDKQMAENLVFLKEVYPNEKIIGWGASYHFANQLKEFEYTSITENYIKKTAAIIDSITGHNDLELSDEIEEVKDLNFAKPMGQLLKDKYGDKLFSLAFSSYKGNYFDFIHNKYIPILAPPPYSIENDIKKEGTKNKLHILKSRNSKMYSSVLGYIPLYAIWSRVFDAVYYIEKMYPPHYLEYDANGKKSIIFNNLNSIKGTILDAETSEQISYADIYYTNNNVSTISKLNGRFLISNSKNQNSYLVFSAIGYESDSLKILKLQKSNTIYLKKDKEDIVLIEVVLTSNFKVLTPEEIIKKARKNVKTNYVQTPYNQSFFFKIIDNNIKDSISYEEALIQTYNKNGINGSNNPETSFFGEIQNLRNNTDKYNNERFNNGVGSLWVVLYRDIILSKSNVLYRTSSYDLTIEGKVKYEGRKVYQIKFVNNSPGSFSTGYGYPAPKTSNGRVFIDVENFAVLKYEHCIQRTPYVSKKSKNTIKKWHNIIQTYKKVNDLYFLNLLELTHTTNVYSPEKKYLNTHLKLEKLVSNNIEIQNINILKRPITQLKKGFKKKSNDPFWKDKLVDFELKKPPKIECEE